MSKTKIHRIPKPIWFGILSVLMVVLAVFLQVWLPYHREQVAIREIESVGGRVDTETFRPQWLSQWGIQPQWLSQWSIRFDRDSWVELEGEKVTDEGLH